MSDMDSPPESGRPRRPDVPPSPLTGGSAWTPPSLSQDPPQSAMPRLAPNRMRLKSGLPTAKRKTPQQPRPEAEVSVSRCDHLSSADPRSASRKASFASVPAKGGDPPTPRVHESALGLCHP